MNKKIIFIIAGILILSLIVYRNVKSEFPLVMNPEYSANYYCDGNKTFSASFSRYVDGSITVNFDSGKTTTLQATNLSQSSIRNSTYESKDGSIELYKIDARDRYNITNSNPLDNPDTDDEISIYQNGKELYNNCLSKNYNIELR